CTILTEFGLQDSAAQQLIEEYQQRYDESLTYRRSVKNCGAGAPGSPGFQPGNTCAKGSGAKDAQGYYQPGVVGQYAGVDTSKWNKKSANNQWALQKISAMEEAAKKGDWQTFSSLKI